MFVDVITGLYTLPMLLPVDVGCHPYPTAVLQVKLPAVAQSLELLCMYHHSPDLSMSSYLSSLHSFRTSCDMYCLVLLTRHAVCCTCVPHRCIERHLCTDRRTAASCVLQELLLCYVVLDVYTKCVHWMSRAEQSMKPVSCTVAVFAIHSYSSCGSMVLHVRRRVCCVFREAYNCIL